MMTSDQQRSAFVVTFKQPAATPCLCLCVPRHGHYDEEWFGGSNYVVTLGGVDVVAVDAMALDGATRGGLQTDETNATWAFVDSLVRVDNGGGGVGRRGGGGGGGGRGGRGGGSGGGDSGGDRKSSGGGGNSTGGGGGGREVGVGFGGGGGGKGAGDDNVSIFRPRPRRPLVLLSHLPLPKAPYRAGSCGRHRLRPAIVQRIMRSGAGVHYQDYLTKESAHR